MIESNRTVQHINELDHHQAKWFAFYVFPRCEKAVHQKFKEQGLESYCPLRKQYRQWSDRTKLVEFPLFPSYAFAKIKKEDYYSKIKYIDKVVKIVDVGGEIISIKDEEIAWIHFLEQSELDFDTIGIHSIHKGDKVKIISGIMKGYEGYVIHDSNQHKLGIEMLFMQQIILVEFKTTELIKV